MATLNGPTKLTFTEDYDSAVAMRAEYLVTDVTYGTASAMIAEALAVAGLPTYGSNPTGYTNLYCVKREVELIPGEQSKFNVSCDFIGAAQLESGWFFSGQASLTQESRTTNYFGSPLYVAYTYPAGDPDWPEETYTQGGTISVMIPQHEISATGIKAIDSPDTLIGKYLGCTNASAWRGGNAYKWLCTNAEYMPHDISCSPKKWRFHFTFAWKREGWTYNIAFTDPRNGKPPYDLVAGVGYKAITWHQPAEYNVDFPDL